IGFQPIAALFEFDGGGHGEFRAGGLWKASGTDMRMNSTANGMRGTAEKRGGHARIEQGACGITLWGAIGRCGWERGAAEWVTDLTQQAQPQRARPRFTSGRRGYCPGALQLRRGGSRFWSGRS